jgi:dolichol-phosphate mannosyltransferase
MNIDYTIIVPVYNEEAVIAACHERLTQVMSAVQGTYELLFVNDGSHDKSILILKEIASSDKHVQVVDFSRNFGHQIAISAGFASARGKAIVVIDADLQDPPEVIPDMIAKWKEGYEVVYGKRAKREGESAFKKATSKLYYRLLSSITDVTIPVDVGDFRLIDRKVCDALNQLKEKHRYVRGLISWLGFKQTEVTFTRAPRFAGSTKYPLKKMISFAMDGIISFSSKPLKLATVPGVVMSLCGFIYFLVIIFQKIFLHTTVVGWASTMCAILFLNGYTLIVLGIIGEYLGRLFDEAKGRPLYVIRDSLFQDPSA